MNIPDLGVICSISQIGDCYVQVYEMFSGQEREEIKLMAVVISLYNTRYMLQAKKTARSVPPHKEKLLKLNE